MAGACHLLDLDPHRVLVAVDPKLNDTLGMSGCLAFAPKRLPRTAEIPCLSARDGLGQRFGIHVCDHENIARSGVGRHAGDRSVGIEFWREGETLFKIVALAWGAEWRILGHERRADLRSPHPIVAWLDSETPVSRSGSPMPI